MPETNIEIVPNDSNNSIYEDVVIDGDIRVDGELVELTDAVLEVAEDVFHILRNRIHTRDYKSPLQPELDPIMEKFKKSFSNTRIGRIREKAIDLYASVLKKSLKMANESEEEEEAE